jgi:hypothetical protein
MITADEARAFAADWLPAWTGNDPEHLASFYTDDVFYLDPSVPAGISGKPAFIAYMRKLLGNNPDWVWRQTEAIPMAGGFVNRWRADIPVGSQTVVCHGVCLVFLRGNQIERNLVYFDTLPLISAIQAYRQARAHND